VAADVVLLHEPGHQRAPVGRSLRLPREHQKETGPHQEQQQKRGDQRSTARLRLRGVVHCPRVYAFRESGTMRRRRIRVPTEHRIAVRYTDYIARSAYRALLWRTQAPLMIAAAVLLVWGLVAVGSPAYGPLAGFGVGVAVVLFAAWLGGLRRARRAATAS